MKRLILAAFFAAATMCAQTCPNGYTLSGGLCVQNGTGALSCSSLSNAAPSCSTDATNAANIASGTLGAARLPAALSSSTSVNGTPIPASTTFAASATTDATNASNIATGTLGAARLPAALSASTSVNGTAIPASGTLTQTIASGTAALGTSAISSGACATVVTVAGSGVATTDNIMADFNADPTSTTGYAPSSSGILTIVKYPTSGNVNFKVCNLTSSSITPGAAVTLNWRVVR